MGGLSGYWAQWFAGALSYGLPVVVIIAAIAAYVRVRLPSLLWFAAAQAWRFASSPAWKVAFRALRSAATQAGDGPRAAWLMRVYPLAVAGCDVVFLALFLVFIFVLVRDVRRLLANQRRTDAPEATPAPPSTL